MEKNKEREPDKLGNILTVFSAMFLLYIALQPIINFIFGGGLLYLSVIAVIGIGIIYLSGFLLAEGYINNRKLQGVSILVALASIGFILFYSNSIKKEVETSTMSKVVDAKVIAEANFSSNYRLVLLSDGDVMTIDEAKNIRDFKIGDKVISIDNVKETIHFTDIFGKEMTGVNEYTLLKSKE